MSLIKKIFHTLFESKPQIQELYDTGITKGKYIGFENLHPLFSLKDYGTTYVYGTPFSGKTEFWYEVMLSMTELYGWRHAIYSPESGEPHEIYADIISKFVRKPFYKNIPGHMTEEERINAENFIHEYFYVIDPMDGDMTVEDFYSAVDGIEKEYGVKIHSTCMDPFNELKHDMSDDNGKINLYLENKLGFIRRNAKSKKRHNCIITHAAAQQPITKDGVTYYSAPTSRQVSGGEAWYRKAMNMICVYRPPAGVIDTETGTPFEPNETHVIIKKYKPKGVGELGTARLYLDKNKNRYYEIFEGERRFAGKQIPRYEEQPLPYAF